MALNSQGDGLRYREDQGTKSIYEMVIKNRPVLEIVVDNADEDLVIHVAKPGTVFSMATGLSLDGEPNVLVPTQGRARRGKHIKPEMQDLVEKFDGTAEEFINLHPDAIVEHIDGMSVYSYVIPRVIYLLADVFVPINGGFNHSEN